MQMRAQNCMMTRDLDASREQDLKSTCIHRSPVASAGWLPSLRTDHAYVSGRLGQLFSGFLIRGRALIRGMAENSHTNQVR